MSDRVRCYFDNSKIPLFKVHVSSSVPKEVIKTLKSGYIGEGPRSKEFEAYLKKFIGCQNIAVLNSCTSAITLALKLSGVGPGNEVISSPMTCVATNTPVLNLGADIKWADIDPDTGNIDPKTIEALITKRTRAILYVHWAGIPADIDEINTIARQFNLKVIEDAAHAFGAKYNGKNIGCHSDFSCFSFQAIKHLTTSDGGAITTNSSEYHERIIRLRWYGDIRSYNRHQIDWDNDILEAGYKMHLNDVLATIGIEQLKDIPDIVRKHKNNANYLVKNLSFNNLIEFPVISNKKEPSYWVLPIKLPNIKYRRKFSKYLSSHGISSSIVHKRNDEYSIFKSYKRALPNLDNYSSRMLCIPCGWWLNENDLNYMLEIINKGLFTIC